MNAQSPDRLLDEPLGFGRHPRKTWAEVDDGYVRMLVDSRDWLTRTLAVMETERRARNGKV